MRGTAQSADDAPGQDSFLDIVANIVGILIILVMVVGVRAGHTSLGSTPTTPPMDAMTIRARATSLQDDVVRLNRRSIQIKQEILARRHEREHWETVVLACERELAERRRELDAEAQAEYDVQRQLAEGRAELDRLTREQISAESAKPESKEIENRPTPISRTVQGKEIHFQLRGERLRHIPLDALLKQLMSEARQKAWNLVEQQKLTDTAGPIAGFRLRYQLERFRVTSMNHAGTTNSGSVVRCTYWELIPMTSYMGESVSEALTTDSEFRRALAQHNPRTSTITVWTYPDSFAALNPLKQELYSLGFQVAARPLPHGIPIGGSPQGSKSSAQ